MPPTPNEITLTLEVTAPDDSQLAAVGITIPETDLDQFISDFEEHFISNYNDSEIL